MLAGSSAAHQNSIMRALAMVLVAAAILYGVYEVYLKKMPTTDAGTAPTQAISLTGVRSDLLQIAQAERSNVALNGKCASLDELISSGAITMNKRERDGYTYQLNCTGSDFQVIAEHPAENFVSNPDYLGIRRSGDCIFIQVTMNEGRTVDQKRAFYKAIADGLHQRLGLRREDVLINLVEVRKENWSFGNGVAQYAT